MTTANLAPEAPALSGGADPSPSDLLVFTVAGERLAIEAAHVEEILSMPRITPLPGAGSIALGIFHHRGELLLAVDIAVATGLTAGRSVERGQLLLLRHGRQATGVPVEAIVGIVRLDTTQADAPVTTAAARVLSAAFDHEGQPIRRLDMAAFLRELEVRLAART